jgi:hypothetical protein
MTSSAWKGLATGVAIGVIVIGGIALVSGSRDSAGARSAPALAPTAAAEATSPATAVALANPSPRTVTVYKSASCGCCKLWVEYMRQNGYTVVTHDVENLDRVLAANGVPKSMESCHTALIGGYVVEGHVPVEDVRRMLAERPKIVGLSVPGMIQGPPGMPGDAPPYEVLAFDATGATAVYARH